MDGSKNAYRGFGYFIGPNNRGRSPMLEEQQLEVTSLLSKAIFKESTQRISFLFIEAVYVSWVIRCCKKGQHKAAKAAGNPTSCNSDDLDRRRFRNELDRIICRHAERICCGQSCDSFRPFVGGDDFRECCDCCALGIRAKQDKDVHCSLPVFRSLVTQNTSLPCLKVFKECCSGSVTKPPITIPTRIPKCSDNFCQQECRDISGQGAKCFCRKGYQLQADQVSCRDINECQLRSGSVCNPFQACVNSPGSFRCVNQTEAACRLGEEKLRGRCIDIDECVRGLHRCGRQQQCVNNDGSYTCTCNTGYQASGKFEGIPESFAIKISKCALFVGYESMATIRLVPVLEFGVGSDEKSDKDECRTQESQCPSNSTCINTLGSYRCECGRGTTLKNNKCEDLDECSIGQYSCPRGSRCENTDGSYKCLIKCSRGQKLSADGQCRLPTIWTYLIYLDTEDIAKLQFGLDEEGRVYNFLSHRVSAQRHQKSKYENGTFDAPTIVLNTINNTLTIQSAYCNGKKELRYKMKKNSIDEVANFQIEHSLDQIT
ncbi:Fibulin-1 [Acropora cervicornis]|uniref:Fibulin-1 n=1 Tax=Acropora cervicornis TaxID=6130 RepID=A0AAD9PTI1_ACRCE|nr:Fibulin-1 [Acropora cervicornis]